MVARVAPEPISTPVAVSDFRARSAAAELRPAQTPVQAEPLPPVLEPVPMPVPQPANPPPSQAFAAALLAARLPARPISADEVRLRLSSVWEPPASSLRLTDRQI